MATGLGVRRAPWDEDRSRKLEAHIVDCAPTILSMLGLPIPDDMEGRVITEIFDSPPTIEREAAKAGEHASDGGEGYSPEELQQVTERLSELGYLE